MTTDLIDLRPAAAQLATLVAGVRDDQLAGATPCPDYTVGDLLDHIGGVATAFTWAATKEALARPDTAASGDAGALGADWRERIPAGLATLGEAWTDPAAWSGMTKAGGIDLPGEIGGLVALDELVVHAWDLAVATGQPFSVDPPALDAVHGFAAGFSGPGSEASRGDIFGPEVPVAPDAPLLARVLGMVGRDPGWQPPA